MKKPYLRAFYLRMGRPVCAHTHAVQSIEVSFYQALKVCFDVQTMLTMIRLSNFTYARLHMRRSCCIDLAGFLTQPLVLSVIQTGLTHKWVGLEKTCLNTLKPMHLWD